MRLILPAAALLLAVTAVHAADLVVRGAVAKPQSLSLAALSSFPATHVLVTQASGRGPVTLDCTGALVSAVLDKAEPQYGAAKNARLAHTLLITADDGYQVALAVAETAAGPGRPAPIFATACGGKPLAAPRLIVPADAEAGRAVNGVIGMEVR